MAEKHVQILGYYYHTPSRGTVEIILLGRIMHPSNRIMWPEGGIIFILTWQGQFYLISQARKNSIINAENHQG